MRVLATTFILMLTSLTATAATTTFALTDVYLTNGDQITGTFDFDGNGEIVVNLITVGSIEFTQADQYYWDASTIEMENANDYALDLIFTPWLLDYTNTEVLGKFGVCTSSGSGSSCEFTETIIPGGTVTAVPIPAAVWLFGSGLGLLGWFRRRQTA